MAAGITDHLWDASELVNLLEAQEAEKERRLNVHFCYLGDRALFHGCDGVDKLPHNRRSVSEALVSGTSLRRSFPNWLDNPARLSLWIEIQSSPLPNFLRVSISLLAPAKRRCQCPV